MGALLNKLLGRSKGKEVIVIDGELIQEQKLDLANPSSLSIPYYGEDMFIRMAAEFTRLMDYSIQPSDLEQFVTPKGGGYNRKWFHHATGSVEGCPVLDLPDKYMIGITQWADAMTEIAYNSTFYMKIPTVRPTLVQIESPNPKKAVIYSLTYSAYLLQRPHLETGTTMGDGTRVMISCLNEI